jgi:hypothetical protein
MGQDEQGKSLRCWIGIHAWVTRVNAGARWQECGRCGKHSGKVRMANRFLPRARGKTPAGARRPPYVLICRDPPVPMSVRARYGYITRRDATRVRPCLRGPKVCR